MLFIENLLNQDIIIASITAAMFTFFLVPIIRKTVIRLNLGIAPNARSSHQNVIAGFAGVSFYFSFIAVLVENGIINNNFNWWLLVALTIVFLVRFIDDLFEISPKFKILGLVIAILVLM